MDSPTTAPVSLNFASKGRTNFDAMTSPNQYATECAGRGCKNIGTVTLQLAVLNMLGDFCPACADGLVRDSLAQFYYMKKENVTLVAASAVNHSPIKKVIEDGIHN